MLMPRARGTFVPIPSPATEIRVELGVSVAEMVVALIVAGLLLLDAMSSGDVAGGLIRGAVFVFWVAILALILYRWSCGADRLFRILTVACDATASPG
jgi:hypothetical protein